LIYVYTSILGGFDSLRPPLCAPEPGVRYICFTDVPVLPRVDPWEFRPVHQVFDAEEFCDGKMSPARTSRLPKILPHLVLPEDCDYSIWHDGNFQLKMSPREIVSKLLRTADWSAHRHPARDCIYDEAEILLREKIGTASLVEAQIARYRAAGHPEHYGLWANGLIVRRHNVATAALNERWWQLFSEGCERDQVSFPVAQRETGVAMDTTIRLHGIYESEYVQFNWHAAFRERGDNPVHWPERARIAARVKRLEEIAGPGGYNWMAY